MKNLIIQGMIKLLEPTLILSCRREDVALVKELIPECQRDFVAIMKKEASGDKEYKTTLQLAESDFLTAENGGACGGVILCSLDKRIVCNNTLQSRLDLCFEELLPQIRKNLFPVPEKEVPQADSAKSAKEEGGHKHHK